MDYSKNIINAANKIINLAIYQIGEEKVKFYKDHLEQICSELIFYSFFDPLLHSYKFQKFFPILVEEKEKIIPILMYDLLRKDIKSCQPNRILGIIEEYKKEENIKNFFKKLQNNEIDSHRCLVISTGSGDLKKLDSELNCDWSCSDMLSQEGSSVFSSLLSNYLCIPNRVKLWLSSIEVVNIANNIDYYRNDSAASNDLCGALGLLNINNEYIQCQIQEM